MIKISHSGIRGACLVIVLLCITTMARPQSTVYITAASLSVAEAFSLEDENGIAATITRGSIEVRMFVKRYYQSGGRSDAHAFLYGIFGNSNSSSPHKQSWLVPYPTETPCADPVNNFYCDPLWLGRQRSDDYKTRLAEIYRKSQEPVGRLPSILNARIDVIVELELQAPATLQNVTEIRLPGLKPLHPADFKSPCPDGLTHPDCETIAGFKDVSDANKKSTIVIAHRGYHGDHETPENSLAAVINAHRYTYRYLEVDVRMTKDNVPFLFHDDYLGYATDFPNLNNTDNRTHTENKTWDEISNLRYRLRYWDGNENSVAVNSKGETVPVRLGKISNKTLNSFEELCQYMDGSPHMAVFLDIKSTPTKRNIEVMRQCIHIGMMHNVLHQLVFKVVRTNAGAGANQLLMPLDSVKKYIPEYEKIKSRLNIHVVDYDPSMGAEYITQWIGEGNVVGFEFDITRNPIFNAPALKNLPAFGNQAAWNYTKSRGFRTGIWSSTALDPRGRPRHDPTSWATGSVMERNINTWQHYTDVRARLEILSLIGPQYITHDRPDEVAAYLQAVGKFNPLSYYRPR